MHLFDKTTTHQKWPLLALPSITKTEKFFFSLMALLRKKKSCMFLDTPKVSRRHGEHFRVRLIHWG